MAAKAKGNPIVKGLFGVFILVGGGVLYSVAFDAGSHASTTIRDADAEEAMMRSRRQTAREEDSVPSAAIATEVDEEEVILTSAAAIRTTALPTSCPNPDTTITSVTLAGNRPVGTYLCDYFPSAPRRPTGCVLTCEVPRFANDPLLKSFGCNIITKASSAELYTSDIVVNHFGPVPDKKYGKPYITLFYQGESKAADGKRALKSYLSQYDEVISFSTSFRYHYTWTHRHEKELSFIERGDVVSSDRLLGGSVQDWGKRESAIAVFVSRCKKGGRDLVIQSLAKHFTVHSFGKCARTHSISTLHPKCAAINKGRYPEKMCAFQKYKFILALDNTRELDYVTEKVYHALLAGAVPIYDGAPNIDEFLPGGRDSVVMLQDFRKDKSKPPALGNANNNNHDVDFAALAAHLKTIEQSDDLQAKLFAWRTNTGDWSKAFTDNMHHPEPTCEVCADALEKKRCDKTVRP